LAAKAQHLSLSSGISLAGLAVANFQDIKEIFFSVFGDELMEAVLKPQKETAIHWLLSYFQDIHEELENFIGGYNDKQIVFEHYKGILKDLNVETGLPSPDFDSCNNEDGHFECACSEIVEQWFDFIRKVSVELNDMIIHSAFQFIFQDRRFLHDFHLELAEYIEEQTDYIEKNYPDYITKKKRIKRQHFPAWLKNAVFHRDKGRCVICRCDLSRLVTLENEINIDHIIPLNLYGTNDSSNMQLLCSDCNNEKLDRNTATSTLNVPFWNMK
jgi:hypothetical protein